MTADTTHTTRLLDSSFSDEKEDNLISVLWWVQTQKVFCTSIEVDHLIVGEKLTETEKKDDENFTEIFSLSNFLSSDGLWTFFGQKP